MALSFWKMLLIYSSVILETLVNFLACQEDVGFNFDTLRWNFQTAVCSSPKANLTLFLLLAAEATLTLSLFLVFFKLDLRGLFILAFEETVDPKLRTDPVPELRLSIEPIIPPDLSSVF